PGAGALAAYLEASSGARPYYLGKPNPFMYACACQRLLAGRPDLTAADIWMVGDTMETDIRGAVEYGLRALLVLTGSTAYADLGDYVYQPTAVLPDVKALSGHLAKDESFELFKPFSERGEDFRERPSNARHQNNTPGLGYRRARPAMTK
ncbi:MAG: HAD hydrolase-like protein, partial [Puniceicoccales bacterium]|nr:HAD hydrolase-like protein [Puniceicoccales bacterium]